MKLNYFIIPLITVLVAVVGSFLTSGDMVWYKTLKLPSIAPPGWFIGLVWNVIFILATISALIVWNTMQKHDNFSIIIGLFVVNALLNVFWSFLFFNQHLILPAVFDAGLLGLSVYALIFFIWRFSPLAAGLLIPYAVWVTFATYLNYLIWLLNR
ncbi:tryptophan-rich sensory protein [Candidatus Woesearchaeota archaeon]|nr:tryptophan-rich sensory protein [Candidatus Woesearchaeota archaeon]